LQPPDYDAIKVLIRDTFVISIHHKAYSINSYDVDLVKMDRFILQEIESIHKSFIMEGGK